MRAFCARRLPLMSQAALAAASTTRVWCSTQSRPEGNEDTEGNKEESTSENVPKEDIAKFHAELEDSKKALEEIKNELVYRTSDAENARRIGREDVEKTKQFGITSFGKDMLEVADTLDKGVDAFGKLPPETLANDKALESIARGIKQSLKVLHVNMSRHGIEKMGVTVGTPFDFNRHEALARLPPTEKAPVDTVCHVLKDGYTIKSRVLRAAQVAVSAEDM